MPRLSLKLMGQFHATLDGETITGFESNKARALLVHLAVESDHPHNREGLAGLLWPDIAESNARRNLRHILHNLRKVIHDNDADPPFLLNNRQSIQLNPASDVQLDVKVFTEAITATLDHPHDSLETCEVCMFLLEEAEQRYNGDFLAGFSVSSDMFETWVVIQRERLHIQALDLLEHLVAYNEFKKNFIRAQYYARRQIELEPWREQAHRQVMRMYSLNGQRGMAIAQYESCRQILERELAIKPEPETTDLYEKIRAGELERTQIERTPETESVIEVVQPVPNNLPSSLTTFVERTALTEEILARLSEPESRLVTLFGPGGSGKTRLALETARVMLLKGDTYNFIDGLYYIPLVAVVSLNEVVSSIAQVLDITFLGEDKPYDQLLDNLRNKNLLLVLDNFEHLVKHTRVVVDMLRTTPGIKILVTSRVKLNLPAEHLVLVSGMSYPSSAQKHIDPSDYNAVKLFSQSARRVKPDFTLTAGNTSAVIQICQLVRGMPIAILLATAWLDTLSLPDIASEIERSLDILDVEWKAVPERQQSMRAVFDHSWQLLREREREILCGLSVFRGGCTKEAGQVVTGATIRDLLALINKSQLHRTPAGRYEMHELLRQFAGEHLLENPENVNKKRVLHGIYFADKLKIWENDLKDSRQYQATLEIEADYENILSAIDWMVENDHFQWLENAVNALCIYFELLNRYNECVQLIEALVTKLRERAGTETQRVLARALAWQAYMTEQTGDYEGARQIIGESFSILGLEDVLNGENHDSDPPTSTTDQSLRAFVFWAAGYCHWLNYPKKTLWFFEESLAMYRELGDQWSIARLVKDVATGYSTLEGANEKSITLVLESLTISQQLRDFRSIMGNYIILARYEIFLGRLEKGKRYLELAQDIADKSGVSRKVFDTFQVYLVNLRLGNFSQVRNDLELEIKRYESANVRLRLVEGQHILCQCYRHLGLYKEAEVIAHDTLELCLEKQYLEMINGFLRELIMLAFVKEDYEAAKQYFMHFARVNQLTDRQIKSHFITGHIALGQGMLEQARCPIRRTLAYNIQKRYILNLLYLLPTAALLISKSGRSERALELYNVAYKHHYVRNSQWFEDVFGKYIMKAAESLPTEVVKAAINRGRALDLWETAEDLLMELNEGLVIRKSGQQLSSPID